MSIDSKNLSPQVRPPFFQVISQEKDRDPKVVLPEEQDKYVSGFSWSALVFGPIYFRAMQDLPTAWGSLLGGLIFYPINIFFALSARRRAWEHRTWQDFEEFRAVQKTWDRVALYSTVILVLAGYLLLRLFTAYFYQALNEQGLDPEGVLTELRSLESGGEGY